MHVFKRRLPVYSADGTAIPYYSPGPRAADLVAQGAAVVHVESAGIVVAIRLTSQPVAVTDARPGSFGIRREHLADGHILFQHKRVSIA
jgi:hypothetical protein